MKIACHPILLIFLLTTLNCGIGNQSVSIQNDVFQIDFNPQMQSRIVVFRDPSSIELGDFRPSEYLLLSSGQLDEFEITHSESGTMDSPNGLGKAEFLTLRGVADGIEKEVHVNLPEKHPSTAVFLVKYTNQRSESVALQGWVNNHYEMNPSADSGSETPFWAYQSASYEDRRDWIQPLKPGFSQKNYLGMNASDYGGGTPVVDIWRKDVGISVGHLMDSPKLNSLPIKVNASGVAEISVQYQKDRTLEPGESMTTFLTFVMVHSGDYFTPLREYRRLMEQTLKKVRFDPYPESAYQPVWCAWGYERSFTMEQVYGTLPKAEELGFKWAVLDDGWQTAEGDWYLKKDKFPRGDRDMKRLTSQIRKSGMRPKLWWVPLAVDPETDLMKDHPDFVLINAEGKTQDISWWNSYYLCPAYQPVRDYTKALVKKMLSEWDFDGLKIDGQHLNAVPPCHNPDHNHSSPDESVEALPDFFRDIYSTALEIKKDAVVEICPCGTSYTFFTMPYMNQPVSSDPLSSWQIRHKGKTFKALMGDSVPYYGDHVELSDGRDDFASTIGIGGVPGSKFTWPIGAKPGSRIDLTPEKERMWAQWLEIYREKMLSKSQYRGELYDIGFDSPETHAISKGDQMYYAFYAEEFSGVLELRGLEPAGYRIRDYVNEQDLGSVEGPVGQISVDFKESLLIEASPVN